MMHSLQDQECSFKIGNQTFDYINFNGFIKLYQLLPSSFTSHTDATNEDRKISGSTSVST